MKIKPSHILITFILLFPSINSSPHGLLFVPGSEEIAEDPYKFLIKARDAASKYKKIKGALPVTWASFRQMLNNECSGREMISETATRQNGETLVFTNPDKKKPEFRYIITGSPEWRIHSTNSKNENNWYVKAGSDAPVRYFTDEKSELDEINGIRKKLNPQGVIANIRNIGAGRTFYTWRYYHPEAFRLLIDTAKDTGKSYSLRTGAVKAMTDTPDVTRFKNFIKEINQIIEFEEKRTDPDDPEGQKILISWLKEAKNVISGKRHTM